jgi:hypothetical protein
MTIERILVTLKTKKVFLSNEIKAITDQKLDFKQVRNYDAFMKLDRLQKELNKIMNGIVEYTQKYEKIMGESESI